MDRTGNFALLLFEQFVDSAQREVRLSNPPVSHLVCRQAFEEQLGGGSAPLDPFASQLSRRQPFIQSIAVEQRHFHNPDSFVHGTSAYLVCRLLLENTKPDSTVHV